MKQFGRVGVVLCSVVVTVALTACSSGSDTTKPTSTTRPPRTSTTTTTPPRPEGWTSVPNAPTLLGLYSVWTGTEYLGGPAGCCDGLGGTAVVAYAPTPNMWRSLAPFPLLPRSDAVAAWTGHEMVVWGGIASRS